MKNEHTARKDDHLVEPVYQALREDSEPKKSNARWKILWVILAVLAIAYVVRRQAF